MIGAARILTRREDDTATTSNNSAATNHATRIDCRDRRKSFAHFSSGISQL